MKTINRTIALLRHLRAERGMALTLFVVVALTAFVAGAIPLRYNQMLDDELEFRVADAPADWRNIWITRMQRVKLLEDESITQILSTGGQAYQDNLDPLLRDIIVGNSYVVQTARSPVTQMRYDPPLPFARSLQLRLQGGVEDQIELVEGRMPVRRAPILFSDLTGTPAARGERPLPRYELLMSAPSLEDLEYDLGDWFTMYLAGNGQRVLIHIVGVFDPVNPEANYWNADTRLLTPVVSGAGTDFDEVVEGTGLFAPDAYPDLYADAGTRPWEYVWRYFVDPTTLDAGNYAAISAAVRKLKATGGPATELPGVTFSSAGNAVEIHNELPIVLSDFARQARLVSSVIALATIGIIAVGLAALGLLAALIADRRYGMIALIRSRGATRAALGLAQLVEGILICLPATALGLLAANLLIDARANAWSLRAAAAIGAVTVLLLLLGARVNILTQLGRLLSERDSGLRRPSFRQLAFEALVVVLALTGIFLIRRRGLAPDPNAEGLGSFDPFLTAVPVLLAIAVGLISLRLYPLPMRLLAWFARWLRGTVLFVGLRRIANQSTAANLPLLVMLLAVGIAIFTSVIFRSVDQAQIDYAWQQVGGDYRIDSTFDVGLPPQLDLTAVPGVEHSARMFKTSDALIVPAGALGTFQSSAGNVSGSTLLALETNELDAITAGTIARRDFPPELLGPPASAVDGTETHPLPAILSTSWPDNAGLRPQPGDVLEVKIIAQQLDRAIPIYVQVVELRDTFPDTLAGKPFVVTRWDNLELALAREHPRPLRPNAIYVGGNGISEDDLNAAIREQVITPELASVGVDIVQGISIVSREDLHQSLNAAPLANGLANSFRLSVVLAAIYAGLSVIIALVLTARARSRDLAYLRTLGLTSAQSFALTLIETIPAVLIASALGGVLGVAIARLIEPGIDLSAFVGPEVPVQMITDRTAILTIAAALALTVTTALIIFSTLMRRVQLGQVLKVGDE